MKRLKIVLVKAGIEETQNFLANTVEDKQQLDIIYLAIRTSPSDILLEYGYQNVNYSIYPKDVFSLRIDIG